MRKALWIVMFVLVAMAITPLSSGKSKSTARKVRCDGVEYRYELLTPAGADVLPAVLLLHGAGDHAASFIETWKPIAEKKHIVLIAPELPRELKFEQAAPSVFRCMVEDAKQEAAID